MWYLSSCQFNSKTVAIDMLITTISTKKVSELCGKGHRPGKNQGLTGGGLLGSIGGWGD